MSKKLKEAKTAGNSVRLRITGTCLGVGSVTMISALVVWWSSLRPSG